MGFGLGWTQWLEGGVFSSNVLVLVNGSPIEEFFSKRGLRQGDPMSPYLLSIVSEGLSGLIRQAIDMGVFKEFKVHDRVA